MCECKWVSTIGLRFLGSSSSTFLFVSMVLREEVDSLFCSDVRPLRGGFSHVCVCMLMSLKVGLQSDSWWIGVELGSISKSEGWERLAGGSLSIETRDAMLSSLPLLGHSASETVFLSSCSASDALVYVGVGVIGELVSAELDVVDAGPGGGKWIARHPEALRSNNATAFLIFDADGGGSCIDAGGDGIGVAWSNTTSSDLGISEGEFDRETRDGESGPRETRSMASISPSEYVLRRKSKDERLSAMEDDPRLGLGGRGKEAARLFKEEVGDEDGRMRSQPMFLAW